MGLVLAQGVSFARLGERVIFLDLRSDRYFGLSSRSEAAFLRLMDGHRPEDADPTRLDGLVREGILEQVSGQGSILPFKPAFPPAASLLDGERLPIGAWRQARAAWALKRSQHELKTRPLYDLVNELSACRSEHDESSNTTEDARRICWAFEAAGLLVTPLRNCLSRSLALAATLRAGGHACELVIGVAINPFQAHAWVQAGDRLLNDRLERVRQFTQILAA
ncbi:lasso peptide biosynthesis B2 protein [Novosphingobium sp. BW1]|uniref:lasso peptide biosynthesis B2 protein n=1 Tax=Novosphingobium sp. BW1 TaxID=2592621 RepID=UPI0011DEFCDE|nr:lasso peptide biosynthesis B2 protein [Novosphingobium sp. BW1]TYC83768.1 lasso peptide biosynthesis B2 protein [Novosphingobium sp. BW1]